MPTIFSRIFSSQSLTRLFAGTLFIGVPGMLCALPQRERSGVEEMSVSADIAEVDSTLVSQRLSIVAANDSTAVITEVTDSVSVDSIVASPAVVLPPLPVAKTTPVDIDREAPPQPVMHYYDKHGEPLQTPVRFLAELDTVTKAYSGPNYRTFNGVSVMANFFDGVMMILGQQRASFDIAADCSIHNWFFPVVEAGIGFSDAHPDDGRCNFKVKPTFYARIGINYNFLYKSNPDYQVFLGLRAGWTNFTYDVYAIQAGSEYYVADGPTQRLGMTSNAFFGQALAGIKVKIWGPIRMGWSFRYAFNIKQTYSNPDFPAWFTPGMGTGPISATFSIGCTFGQRPPKEIPLPEALK